MAECKVPRLGSAAQGHKRPTMQQSKQEKLRNNLKFFQKTPQNLFAPETFPAFLS